MSECREELTFSLDKAVVVDADIASAFAKIERQALLLGLFSLPI